MFKNISIKGKITIQSLVSVIAILLLLAVVINFTNNKVNDLENIKKSSKLLSSISLLIHETQKERGMTAGFLGSNGESFKDKLPEQRILTNEKLENLKNILNKIDIKEIDANTYESISLALTDISQINDIRTSVDNLDIKGSKAIAYYTNMNGKFLNTIVKISNFSKSPQVTKEIIAYLNFLISKERAGIERAVGTNITTTDYFLPGFRAKFSSLITSQDSYLESFNDYASNEAKAFLKDKFNNKSVLEVQRMRNIILEANEIGGFNVDSQYWFDTITLKLGLLKKIEDFVIANLRVSNTNTAQNVQLATAFSNLVHETQKERGATAGFIGSKGKKFIQKLPKQRLLTNKKMIIAKDTLLKLGNSTLNLEARKYLKDGLIQLDKLNTIRASVDDFSIGSSKAINYYTNMHAIFINIIGAIAKDATTAEEARDLSAWYNFIMSKERAGIERAVMSNSFARNKFLPGMQKKFTKLVTSQDSFLLSFQKLASNEVLEYYKNTVSGKVIEEVNRLRDIAFNTKNIGGFGIDYNYWFDTITLKINILKEIDDYLSKSLEETIEKQLSSETNELYITLFLASMILIIIIVLSRIIGSLIKKSIDEFQDALLNFFRYLNKEIESTTLLDDSANDEIGKMSKVVNENINKIQKGIEEDKTLINSAKSTMARVSKGWYSETIDATTSNVALEDFKNQVNTMINDTKQNFVKVNTILEEYAHYDYRNELKLDDIEKGGVFELLVNDINKLREAITTMLVENKSNGLTLTKSSDILLSSVNTLNANSNQAAAALEETAAALEEVTSNIESTTNNVIKMASHGNEVKNSVINGQNLANETTEAMNEINTEVTAISDAISVIDQIAFQTNILSLNAAVEAATAGEAGKGFAVVAQEVRNLANRSADAANEIKSLVEKATNKANSGKNISNEMINGYSQLNESISKTLELISDVEIASKEQQKGILQINDAVTSLDRQTQENAKIASDTDEVAKQTDVIAKLIVTNADEKEFNGKNSVKVKNLDKTTPSLSEVKTIESKDIVKKVVSNKDKDEWESF